MPELPNFRLHPNPTTGALRFSGGFSPGEPIELTVLNLQGQAVLNATLQTPSTHLNLPAGVYLVEVRQGDRLGRRKLVLH